VGHISSVGIYSHRNAYTSSIANAKDVSKKVMQAIYAA